MKNNRGNFFFPVLINLQNFPCLVVGGGDVAGRKVLSLLDFNAHVTIVSPKVSKEIENLKKKGSLSIIKTEYDKKYLKGIKIVFCATDNPKINKKVHDDCKQNGILLNVADVPDLCDFILPANVRRGNLTISISSQGKSPFFVKEMKKKLNQIIPPVYEKISELAADYRKQVLSDQFGSKSANHKANMFRKFTDIDWESVVREKGKKKSKELLNVLLRETD